MPRKLKNWIDGFMTFTEGKGSPLLWRRWSAIFIIASAMERKTWLTTAKGRLYPNLYTILVGGAGAGKSLAIDFVTLFLGELRDASELHLTPKSVTKASLIDRLAEAERKVVRPMMNPPILSYNSLTAVISELGVFLPAYDNEFMNTLTDLWDCKDYSETRRTHKISIDIKAAQLSLFGGTTPSYLNSFLPEGAWDQGFMSRVILIYSPSNEFTDLFATFTYDTDLEKNLMADLKSIAATVGEFTVTDEVKEAINEWARRGGEPAPMHPKLTHYSARRPAHLLKLCMIACIADSEDRIITLDHFAEALDWLTEAEFVMPDIFKAMKSGGDGRVIEECYHYLYEQFIRDKKPILEHRVYHFLQERTPAHNVDRILQVMEKAGLIRKMFAEGGVGYEPRGKKAA